jgi:DNA polymerase-3 subunit delta'
MSAVINIPDICFPWQQEVWQHLQAMQSRLPHALLLYGTRGIGKSQFAHYLARSVLCESPSKQGQPCDTCQSCSWVMQYSHPDFRRIRPENLEDETNEAEGEASEKKSSKASKTPSKDILIDQIRSLSDIMNVSTHRQGKRVILLYPAEALNVPAANALLKSLEEPNPNTLFILVSHSIDSLLPTIISRCHKIAMPMPTHDQSLQWLQTQELRNASDWLAQEGGSPLSALIASQSEDVNDYKDFIHALQAPDLSMALKCAEKMHKFELSKTLRYLQCWIYDILSFKQIGKIRYYPNHEKELVSLAAHTQIMSLLQLIKNMQDKQAISNHSVSPKLFLEECLMEYVAIFKMVR